MESDVKVNVPEGALYICELISDPNGRAHIHDMRYSPRWTPERPYEEAQRDKLYLGAIDLATKTLVEGDGVRRIVSWMMPDESFSAVVVSK